MTSVLNVSEEFALRRGISMELVRQGYSVAEADSVLGAEEALAAWNGGIDVMVLDVCLRDQSGWDLLRRLHARSQRNEVHDRPTIPVIMLTAGLPDQRRLDELHPDAVLPKPFPILALLRLIERLATRHAAEVDLAG